MILIQLTYYANQLIYINELFGMIVLIRANTGSLLIKQNAFGY